MSKTSPPIAKVVKQRDAKSSQPQTEPQLKHGDVITRSPLQEPERTAPGCRQRHTFADEDTY